jgi:hypothetical protein
VPCGGKDTTRDVAISFLFVGGAVLIKLLAFGRSSSLSRLVLNFLCRGSTYSGSASLAFESSAAVLADGGAAAALALASSAAVLTKSGAAAALALTSLAAVLTDGGAAAALAVASHSAVLADACSAANDTIVPHAIMLTDT